MNERLGMLLLRKRRELAMQSRVKPMTKTQQRDYMRDFVKNNSDSVYNQGWTMKKVKALSIEQLRLEFKYIQQHLERSNLLNFRRSTFRHKPTLDAPSAKRANQGAPQVPTGVPAAPSFPADVSVHAAPSSTSADILVPAVSSAHAAASVPTKTVKLLGAVDELYQKEEPDTFALLLWGDLHVLFQSLDDADTLDFWRNQDSWRIRSMRLYPRAQVHVLETMTDNPYVCRCLLSSHCSYFGAYAETWVGGP
nr:hypothetical protein [Tanacetum cinerariifolium]